jgi:hypothetical protein
MNPHEFQSIERNRFPLSVCSKTTSERSRRRRAFIAGFCIGAALVALVVAMTAEILSLRGSVN